VSGPGRSGRGPRPVRGVAVVVPARNEQERLPACLASIDAAAARVDVPVQVVVVLDRCTDRSLRIARSWPGVLDVETDAGCVGTARALGAARVLTAGPVVPHELWLAGTDADTRVPAAWLAHQVMLAEAGYDLVLGTVDLAGDAGDAGDDVGVGVERAWRRRYREVVRADGTHPHVHGANLGVRGSTYLDAGGWPPVAAHEDRLLVAAARRAGATVATTDLARVVTSSRRLGRVPAGVARDLQRLAARSDQLLASRSDDGAAA
jgi:glycosyltransferase involved in cell wall biosynthesis